MSPDAELMLIFGTLHLIAVALGAFLFVMFLRSEATKPWKPPDEDDGGGGGNDRLPDAPAPELTARRPAAARRRPAAVRLRSHERLRDLTPQPLAPPGARAGAAAPPGPALGR